MAGGMAANIHAEARDAAKNCASMLQRKRRLFSTLQLRQVAASILRSTQMGNLRKSGEGKRRKRRHEVPQNRLQRIHAARYQTLRRNGTHRKRSRHTKHPSSNAAQENNDDGGIRTRNPGQCKNRNEKPRKASGDSQKRAPLCRGNERGMV